MPMFEYQCGKCGHISEILVKSSGKKKQKCEKCGSSDMSKLFSSFAVGRAGCSESKQCGGCNIQCPHS